MVRYILFISLFVAGWSAEASVNECSAHLITEINYHAGRALDLCKQAQKANVNVMLFGTCVASINSKTKLAPEIIAPYCIQRTDVAYRSCVIDTYNSDSNDNAFKSCLKKSAVSKSRTRSQAKLSAKQSLPAPSSVKISVL